jgi:hypothetical protein
MTREDFAAELADHLRRRGVVVSQADLEAFAAGVDPKARESARLETLAEQFIGRREPSLDDKRRREPWTDHALAAGIACIALAPVWLSISVIAGLSHFIGPDLHGTAAGSVLQAVGSSGIIVACILAVIGIALAGAAVAVRFTGRAR